MDCGWMDSMQLMLRRETLSERNFAEDGELCWRGLKRGRQVYCEGVQQA